MKNLNLKVFSIFLLCCLWTAQAGSRSCYKIFLNLKSTFKGNNPKHYSKQISNSKELAEFMTKGGELAPMQGSLFEIYMNNFFGDFSRYGIKDPLKFAADIMQKYPNELYKLPVREQEIAFFVKERDKSAPIEPNFFQEVNVEILRLRSLSLQESPFHGCLGADCSRRSYFDKAFEPHFLYFTLTDIQYRSRGHITVILGKASNSRGKTLKLALVDKVQNVPNEKIIPMLEGIRRSLKEHGYVLALAEDVGGENGLSSDFLTRNFFATQILPNLKNKLKDFKPMESEYQFEDSFSRENESLLLREFEEAADTDSFKIHQGEIHSPKRLKEELTVKKLYEAALSLEKSENERDRLKYLSYLPALMRIEELDLSDRYIQIYLHYLMKDKRKSFKLKRQAFFSLIQIRMEKDEGIGLHLGFLNVYLSKFSEEEQRAIIDEMSNWKITKGYKRKFIEMLSEKVFFYYKADKLRAVFESPIKIILDLNLQLKRGRNETALHWAVEKGREDQAELFIENGININTRDNFGRTALHWAVEKGRSVVIKLLLDNGADINIRDNFGRTALQMAVESGKEDMVRLLLEGGVDLETKDKFGHVALHRAVSRGEENIARLLLEGGANPEAKDNFSRTALQMAVQQGNEDMAKLLLERGADPEAKYKFGKTVLQMAVESGKEDIARLFLEEGG